MRKILPVLILLFLTTLVRAQQDDPTTDMVQYSRNAISQLDPNTIPTGVLYDLTAPLAALPFYGAQNDSVPSGPVHFQQAYFEYYQSIVQPNGDVLTPGVLVSKTVQGDQDFQHNIGILALNYAMIDPQAVEDGRLTIANEKLAYGPNPQSPFTNNTAFVISSLGDGEPIPAGKHSFVLNGAFYLGNRIVEINALSLDFHDGNGYQMRSLQGMPIEQYVTMQPFDVDFAADGVYTVDVKAEFADGTSVFTKFNVTVGKKSTSACNDCITIQGCDGGKQFNITGDVYPQLSDYGVTATAGTGKAYVFYSNANCGTNKITKPVIFLDGYDPDNSRDVARIYTKYINKPSAGPGSIGLADKLRQDGYDLIILDYGDGGTFIERNALVVTKLIQTLWSDPINGMGSNEFVVIGPSMGALVGQFALGYMAKNGIADHTRLFMSFDGPHKGANVPIGVQKLVEYALQSNSLNNITGGKLSEMKHNIIENPAARQMILHHVFANSTAPAPDWYRNTFLSHVTAHTIPYPSANRNVAVINGNINGVLNPNITPCQKFARIQHYFFAWWPPTFQIIDWTVFGTSNGASCYSGRFYTLWPLGNIVGGIPAGWTNTYASGLPNNRSYDNSPGSLFGVDFNGTQKSLNDYLGWLPFNNFDIGNINKFTFIPTVSSGDIIQSTADVYQDQSNKILAKCAGTTPFDRVYGNNYQTNHVDVDQNIGGWFQSEIKQIAVPWNTVTKTINATLNPICNGQTSVLSVAGGLPAGSSVTWSPLPYNFTYSGQTTPSLSVTKPSTTPSTVQTFYMNATSSCGNFTGSKVITGGLSGTPGPSISIAATPNCPKRNVTFSFPSPPSGTTYNWTVSKNNCTSGCTYNGTNGGSKTYLLINGDKMSFTLTATNACGSEYVDGLYQLSVTGCSGSSPIATMNYLGTLPRLANPDLEGELSIDVHPNPSSAGWNILFDREMKGAASVSLSSMTGQRVYQQDFASMPDSYIYIPDNGMAAGMYILDIKTAAKSFQVKLIKE